MKKIILSFLIAHFAFLIAQVGVAQIIHVPADQPTIQAGINAACDGDTVLVAEGVYYENLNMNGKAITLASHFLLEKDPGHITNTVIDGSQPSNPDLGAVITLENGEDTTTIIHGFTIRGGTGNWYPAFTVRAGGGIVLDDCGATIEFNYIEYNNLTTDQVASGGGISQGPYLTQAWIIIRGNRIQYHTIEGLSAQGAGISAFGNARIIGNIIQYNETVSLSEDCYGGGAFFSGTIGGPKEIYMTHNVYTDNAVSSTMNVLSVGAGLGVWGYSGYIGHNTITSNEIESVPNGYCWGAGISLSEIADGLVFENNIVSENFGSGQGNLKGGGIHIEASNVTLRNNLISGNGGSFGGGICITNNTVDTVKLICNTITGNTSTVKGGGLYINMASVSTGNSIFWNNDAPEDPEINVSSGYISVNYSDVEGGWTGTGNIDSDPLFRNLAGEDYRLTGSSPCVDSGDPMLESDPDNTRSDMGCYPFFQGSRINVKQDGTGHFTDIQTAIDATTTGDTVIAYEGTYYENIDFHGGAFTLASEYLLDGDETHIDNTILDGSHATDMEKASTVSFMSGEDTTSHICGFTITGGSGMREHSYDIQAGGGIMCYNSGARISHNKIVGNHVMNTSSFAAGAGGIGTFSETGEQWIIIEDNMISGNTATAKGFSAFAGGINILQHARIRNNVIEYNSCTNHNVGSNGADGGGIEVECWGQYMDVSIKDNIIRSNTLNAYNVWGAGISLHAASVLISGNTISHNTGTADYYAWGCGLFSNLAPEDMEISYNMIENNLSVAPHALGVGVEIEQNEGEVYFKHNICNDNYAEAASWRGSGCFIYAPIDPVNVIYNEFKGNLGTTADGLGGGLMLQLTDETFLSIDGNLFTDNYADKGGGLYARNSFNVAVSNNMFSGNTSTVRGGAINFFRTADESLTGTRETIHPVVVNNTFVENSCDSLGGAICDNYPLPSVIFNNIFRDDYAKHGAEIYYHGIEVINVNYCDIDTNLIEVGSGGEWAGGGNFYADPLFLDEEFHLDQASPCVDAGVASLEVEGVTYYAPDLDFEGSPRPFGAGIDIGADEWPAVNVPEPPVVNESGLILSAYPNPTSGISHFSFHISQYQYVSLKIYDLHGREVAVVLDEKLLAGEHDVQFDVSGLPGGIYFLKVQAGKKAAMRKIVVLR